MRFILSFVIILILAPQEPEWNPIIRKLRSKNLFFTYKTAKMAVNRFTWTILLIFYFFHFR